MGRILLCITIEEDSTTKGGPSAEKEHRELKDGKLVGVEGENLDEEYEEDDY